MTLLEEKKARLKQYRDAETKILLSQSYQAGDISKTNTNLNEVRKGIAELETDIARIESGRKKGARAIRIIPRG